MHPPHPPAVTDARRRAGSAPSGSRTRVIVLSILLGAGALLLGYVWWPASAEKDQAAPDVQKQADQIAQTIREAEAKAPKAPELPPEPPPPKPGDPVSRRTRNK